ncbi:MAG TPA: RsmE family RNA methyltransferase [bacterium]|jgi:16S rRNA (uracil1498-N3)-methyltransferase|nr:RsmE family RNA methyltransferase [bacterium]
MHRFYVDPAAVEGHHILIRGLEAHHVATVLRLRPGDRCIAFDGTGLEYVVRLILVADTETIGEIEQRHTRATVPLRLTLVQGVPKGTKMDLVIRMGTELGIGEFVPARTARSVAGGAHRAERWRRIAREAAKQSRRADVPEVREPAAFVDALDGVRGADLIVVLWEGERGRTLADALRGRSVPAAAALIVGPEGGLERDEVEQAIAAGAVPVTLGPLILRTETAGIAAAAMLFYEFALRRPRQEEGRPSPNP